jgi:hypothetical protein
LARSRSCSACTRCARASGGAIYRLLVLVREIQDGNLHVLHLYPEKAFELRGDDRLDLLHDPLAPLARDLGDVAPADDRAHPVVSDRLEVVADVDVARASDLVEQVVRRDWEHIVGDRQLQGDLLRVAGECLHHRHLHGVGRDRDGIGLIGERQLEVQAGLERTRLPVHDLTEARDVGNLVLPHAKPTAACDRGKSDEGYAQQQSPAAEPHGGDRHRHEERSSPESCPLFDCIRRETLEAGATFRGR